MKYLLGLLFFCIGVFSLGTSHATPSAVPNTPLKPATFVTWQGGKNNLALKNIKTLQLIQKKLRQEGYDLATEDINPPANSDLILVGSKNYTLPSTLKTKPFLWLIESPISVQVAVNPGRDAHYQKIFTYDPILAQQKNYVYTPIPYFNLKHQFQRPSLQEKEYLVAQVAGLHDYGHPKELYQERRNIVLWFLKKHPRRFIFAGSGEWNLLKSKLPPSLQDRFSRQFKGYVDDKISFLRKAKFGLAYENAIHQGYVTEKIFDVMLAGTVPIYLGAPDIEKFVPKACFINQKDFKSYEELYHYIRTMPTDTYQSYLDCIEEHMTNFSKHFNSSEQVSKIILNELLQAAPKSIKATP